MNISIIGTGYVGLVTGACLAKLGNNIILVDIDDEKIKTINKGVSPIFEKGLDELLTQHQNKIKATNNYTTAIQNTDITFICVGTPSKKNGDIDLTFITKSTTEIGKQLKHKKSWHLTIVKSTVLPGTTQNLVLPLLEKQSEKKAKKHFGIASNPEFLRQGNAVQDFLQPDRIIIGTQDKKSKEILTNLYKNFTCPIIKTSLSAAEMIKYASNSFLATKISFINEIGNICKKLNIDTYDVAEGMGLDKRIGRPFLDSGIGWGGSCFPKDTEALVTWAKKEKHTTTIIESAITVNNIQPLKLIELLQKHIPHLKNKKIGILGLSFKPNTDDIRYSRAIPIIKKLIQHNAHIKAYDPQAITNFKKIFPNIEYCKSAKETLDSDAILITTNWEEFKKLNFKDKIVIDGRRLKEAGKAKIYEGVCW